MSEMNGYESYKLRKFLSKLGIKSADISWFEDALNAVAADFGLPDEIFMSPKDFEQIQKTFKDIKKEKK